ncbi:MAG: YfiR/HmsC family protein [Bacteroidales bacterium]|jgi:serine phosphatase RsbU (regulator of sigma subunit)|nr:YfiR/HmsC family protein [Bacteroidales bacterium]
MALIAAFYIDSAAAQGFADYPTTAAFILDIAKNIDFGPAFRDSSVFRIGILDRDEHLFLELGNQRKTRPYIDGKPVELVKFNSESQIRHTQVLYLNRNSGFSLQRVSNAIFGRQTLLITEGYEFRESMISFMGVESGIPKYGVNEDMIRRAGMSVNSNMLGQAIKSREDWEKLFGRASEQIAEQRDTIREQLLLIESQKNEIMKQRELLTALDRDILEKENELSGKQRMLEEQYSRIEWQQSLIKGQRDTILVQQSEVAVQRDTLAKQGEKISYQLFRIDDQIARISEQELRIRMQLEAIEKQKLIIAFSVLALLLGSILVYFIYRGYRIKKEANERLEEKNRTILLQKDEIERQRDHVSAQRDLIAYHERQLTDSIMYARRIQAALLPSLELFSDRLEHFVLYKPLAIVSGDFYWVSKRDRLFIVICADCTGHGVPGAFMSMLGVTLLNEIVNGRNIIMPDQILEKLREGVISSLNQTVNDDSVKDGMDIAACTIDFESNILWFSGASNPLYLVRGNELMHYRADKMPVAIHYRMSQFTLHRIDLKKGDAFYIFSDGFADQFGGQAGKKFMTGQLKRLLAEMSGMPMLAQGERLSRVFGEWKGDSPQIDDVTLIGIRY